MTAPTATAPAAPPRIVDFTATRKQNCTSGADCDGVQVGHEAAYVGWSTGSGAVCGPCLAVIKGNIAAATGETPAVEQNAASPLDEPMPSDPFLPEGSTALPVAVDPRTVTDLRDLLRKAMDHAGRVDTEKLSENSRREIAGRGWMLRGADGVWSVTTAGYAELGEPQSQVDEHGWPQDQADVESDARSALAALRTSLTDDSYDLSAKNGRTEFRALVEQVLEHLDDMTVANLTSDVLQMDVHGVGRVEVENRLCDALIAERRGIPPGAPASSDQHECDCKRVSKKATFGRTADGRPTHEHCGGLLREKHMHLLPADQQPQTTESTTEQESEARDDGDDDAAGEPARASADTDPGAGTGAGESARSADGAAGAGEGGVEAGERAGEGDHRRDQGGDESARVRRSDHPEPVRGEAVEAGAGGVVEVRLDGPQEGRPGDLGEVGEEVDRLALRRDGLTGLAAFYGQPEDDDPAPGAGSPAASTDTAPTAPRSTPAARPRSGEAPTAGGTLAAFYAQPDDREEEGEADPFDAYWPNEDPPQVEVVREFEADQLSDRALLDALARRYGGEVTALVINAGERYPRVVEMPR